MLCSKCEKEERRTSHVWCKSCHAEYMRQYRARGSQPIKQVANPVEKPDWAFEQEAEEQLNKVTKRLATFNECVALMESGEGIMGMIEGLGYSKLPWWPTKTVVRSGGDFYNYYTGEQV